MPKLCQHLNCRKYKCGFIPLFNFLGEKKGIIPSIDVYTFEHLKCRLCP